MTTTKAKQCVVAVCLVVGFSLIGYAIVHLATHPREGAYVTSIALIGFLVFKFARFFLPK